MNPSTRILIKDFGPIKEAFIEFNKVTFFIGPQGAGKSTIAKLYSMFTWLEKKFIRGMEDFKQFEKTSKFKDEVCSYHRLSSFFKLSSLDSLAGLKSVPQSLLAFKDEYDNAKKSLSGIK